MLAANKRLSVSVVRAVSQRTSGAYRPDQVRRTEQPERSSLFPVSFQVGRWGSSNNGPKAHQVEALRIIAGTQRHGSWDLENSKAI